MRGGLAQKVDWSQRWAQWKYIFTGSLAQSWCPGHQKKKSESHWPEGINKSDQRNSQNRMNIKILIESSHRRLYRYLKCFQ